MNYLYLQSALHDDPTLAKAAQELFAYIGGQMGCDLVPGSAAELAGQPLAVLYLATGGTAGLARQALETLSGPVALVTSGSQNSLSASMETLTWLSQQGREARLLHGSREEVAAELSALTRAAAARARLKGLRLGLVGHPSDWLISTGMDYAALRARIGIEMVELPMEMLEEEIARGGYPESDDTRALLAKDFDRAQVEQALDIYGALDRLAERHRLGGLSVRCFDLLTSVKNTGCLGLALLNARGIYGGCEGDVPSLVSMAILGEISGQPVFLCNPSRVNRLHNEIVFAHCTLPLNMPQSYRLATHFESDIGVAIAGEIPPGPVTIFKASGDLSRRFLSEGEILASLNEDDLCRTQIRLCCESPVGEFLNSRVGNHYLVCPGRWAQAVDTLFELL